MLYWIYRSITFLGGPFIDLYLKRRKRLGKEDPKRFSERLGKASFPRPSGPLVWMHAASVGEALSVLPLINTITEKYPQLHILMTTGTVASARIIEGRLPERAFHQYVPIDRYGTVRRFLKHWKPDVAFWVESEFWPNLLVETKNTGRPMILLNGRVSNDSFEKWMRYPSLAHRMISCFSLVLAQTEQDRDRLEELGAKTAKYLGNLKYDAPPLPVDAKATGVMLQKIGERPVWLAASTHPGEEEVIFAAHQRIKAEFPDVLTIVVPRHPGRAEELAGLARRYEQTVQRRSESDTPGEETEVFIADTMGELGMFYRLAPIVFVGGSLVEHGGQNPLEAARLECALLTGPHTENFADIYRELKQANGLLRIVGEEDLAMQVTTLMQQADKQSELAKNALELVQSKAGVLEAVVKELDLYLSNIR